MIKYMRISTEQMHLATQCCWTLVFVKLEWTNISWMTEGCNTQGWVTEGKIWTLMLNGDSYLSKNTEALPHRSVTHVIRPGDG